MDVQLCIWKSTDFSEVFLLCNIFFFSDVDCRSSLRKSKIQVKLISFELMYFTVIFSASTDSFDCRWKHWASKWGATETNWRE